MKLLWHRLGHIHGLFPLFLFTSSSLFYCFKTCGDALPVPEVRLATVLVQTIPVFGE